MPGETVKSTTSKFVSPSLHKEKLGSQWTDFHEIWYFFVIFRKSFEKVPFIRIWQE